MECPKCRARRPRQAAYCLRCGTKFDDPGKPKKPIPGFPKECPRCFAPLASYALYCYKCGLRQPEMDELEAYMDPDAARLQSYRILRLSRWISLGIFLVVGVPVGFAISEGWVSDMASRGLLWALGVTIFAWEVLLYAYSAHVAVRLRPASERAYDFHKWLAPALRFLKPLFDDLSNRVAWAAGKMSTKDYEEKEKKILEEATTLREKVKALEAELRMKGGTVRVIRPPPEKKEGKKE